MCKRNHILKKEFLLEKEFDILSGVYILGFWYFNGDLNLRFQPFNYLVRKILDIPSFFIGSIYVYARTQKCFGEVE